MNLSPLNKRRFKNFRSNKRGWYSFWIFFLLFIISIFANFIANDKPILVKYDNKYFVPVLSEYAETTFGGDFETEADYRDPYVKKLEVLRWDNRDFKFLSSMQISDFPNEGVLSIKVQKLFFNFSKLP